MYYNFLEKNSPPEDKQYMFNECVRSYILLASNLSTYVKSIHQKQFYFTFKCTSNSSLMLFKKSNCCLMCIKWKFVLTNIETKIQILVTKMCPFRVFNDLHPGVVSLKMLTRVC